MADNREDWQLCLDWILRCKVIENDHKLAREDAQVFDFAAAIRDGVIICHLLNALSPNVIDLRDFSQRPQMSQFLCMKNIRLFLRTCKDSFGLTDEDLFEPADLYEIKDFAKFLNTLSILSCSDVAVQSGIRGFKTKKRQEIYYTLQSVANNSLVEDTSFSKFDDEIYQALCAVQTQRQQSVRESAAPQSQTKRSYCIRELVETEKNYVDALKMIIECFLQKFRNTYISEERKTLIIPEEDCNILFLGIEDLYTIHTGFYSDLSKACNSRGGSVHGVGHLTISDCFIKWKEKFLIYGNFCSNLSRVQIVLEKLQRNATITAQFITECQKTANDGKFRLRDLLSVPMQRVLKYHLLLKELIKNTDEHHPERRGLEKALEETQDLAGYVNETKRDNENLQWIKDVQQSIVNLDYEKSAALHEYGRLHKDGELRVRTPANSKDKPCSVFLFDKILLICKSKGSDYHLKESVILDHYTLEEQPANSVKDKFIFVLSNCNSPKTQYVFICKTKEDGTKWTDCIKTAYDNRTPPFSKNPDGRHWFVMQSFSKPTICDVCRRLLRGVFYQGYRCQNTGMVVHKDCIAKAKDIAGPPVIPPKQIVSLSAITGSRVKAISAYRGEPAPPDNRAFLTFEENDVFALVSTEDDRWWLGRHAGKEGYFPKRLVTIFRSRDSAYLEDVFVPSDSQETASRGMLTPAVQPQKRFSSRDGSPLRPSSPLPPYYNSGAGNDELGDYPWFVGEMTRDGAQKLLENLPDGTFLIRISNSGGRKGQFALSIKYGKENPIKHIMLQKSSEKMFFLVDCKMFRSIPELVQYYQENSLESSFPEVPSILLIAYRETLAPAVSDPHVVGICFAKQDYVATDVKHISLKMGEKIGILNKSVENRGWWKGKLSTGKTGYFPSEYVAEILHRL